LREKLAVYPEVAFDALDFNPTPQDFEYMTTTGQIDRLRQYVLDRGLQRFHIVASSFGGLIALHYAHRFGGVDRMLLLAPVLHWLSDRMADGTLEQWRQAGTLPTFHFAFGRELPLRYDLEVDGQRYLEPIPPPAPLTIIHGDADTDVPTGYSRHYAATFPGQVRLVEVKAGHDLNGHLDLMWNYVESFLLTSGRGG
jgi:pimeloyl-ACP methyl ester carboxylesterase